MPGAVLMVQRNGKVAYFEASGSLDAEQKTPVRKDAIFRIFSMTKPITTAWDLPCARTPACRHWPARRETAPGAARRAPTSGSAQPGARAHVRARDGAAGGLYAPRAASPEAAVLSA